jgi:hypothetical protein
LLRSLAESTPKVPGEMRLVGKSGFRRNVGDRAPFVCRQKLSGIAHSTAQEVLVRRHFSLRLTGDEVARATGLERWR